MCLYLNVLGIFLSLCLSHSDPQSHLPPLPPHKVKPEAESSKKTPSWVWQGPRGSVCMAVFRCLAEVTLGLGKGREGGQGRRGTGSQRMSWPGSGRLAALCGMEGEPSLPIPMQLNEPVGVSSFVLSSRGAGRGSPSTGPSGSMGQGPLEARAWVFPPFVSWGCWVNTVELH